MKSQIKKQVVEGNTTFKMQWKVICIALIVVSLFYVAASIVPQGWLSWLAAVPPCILIGLTAWARVNDIDHAKTQLHWQVRRMGLIFAGSSAVMIILAPFTLNHKFPSWELVIILWGFSLSWLTTPGLVPWWRYITGEEPTKY